MALDLRVAVRKAIVNLRREISKTSSSLASLKHDLARYEKVHGFLNGRSTPARTKANSKGKSRRKTTDWNSVLKRLPGAFAFGNVTNLAKTNSNNYAHRVLAKWVKQRKVKRVGRGRYQKV